MTVSPGRDNYHHGDLRRAILDAAEEQLAETGVSGFSLRRIAARVGVSHTAPAHHFGDLRGLTNALAARGFKRLLAAMEVRRAVAETPYDRLIGAGLGYLDFALEHRALFRLIYEVKLDERASAELGQAAMAALMHLAEAVAAYRGATRPGSPPDMEEVLTCWSRAHGLAGLVLAGYIHLPKGEGPAARDAMFARMLTTHFPRP